jgi:multicomponent Na+:H+ antiporter subunit A
VFTQTPLQAFLAAVLVSTAVAAAASRRRFVAVVFLGAVGYTMGVVFVVQGAPDLALTQFAVETLSIVVFMLVLRHLPGAFERRAPAIGTWLRLLIASTVATGVFVLAIISAGSRTEAPLSREVVSRAAEDGGGSNVVNVVLVDIRGLDTLGEVSVLVLASVGVVALARSGRRPPGAGPAPPADDRPRPASVPAPDLKDDA